MIVTRTPFRISFCGGGSDLPSFFLQNGGCVVSTTIDKYVYITANPCFDASKTILKYSKIEDVHDVYEVMHPIIREVLTKYSTSGVEINSTSDIPSGTGMGSSSQFAVGLLNTVKSYNNMPSTKKSLAEEACDIEINRLKGDIGCQDQYAAAYGGFNFIEFNRDGSINVSPINLSPDEIHTISDNLLLFYLGGTRDASEVIHSYSTNTKSISDKKHQLCELAVKLKNDLNNGNIDSLGRALHNNWVIKKSLSQAVSNNLVDEAYQTAMDNGAVGGKLLGAGGSGFLLIYADKKDHNCVRQAMASFRELPFNFEYNGSKVLYNDGCSANSINNAI